MDVRFLDLPDGEHRRDAVRICPTAYCSSSWCWKLYRINSQLVYPGSFSMLMTWCSSQAPRGSVSPSSRRGRLAWKVKGSASIWRRTKFTFSCVSLDVLKKSDKYPCAVCCKGGGNNFIDIECSQCKMWVHKKCSGITGQLVADENYICPRCIKESQPIDGRPMAQVDVEGTKLDVDATFCCTFMLFCGGDCDSAIAARCYVIWRKFRKISPVLTSRHLSPKVRGKVYTACVCSVMLHGSITWGSIPPTPRAVHHNDHAIIHWICDTKNQDKTPSTALLKKLDIKDITTVLRSGQLRWYGHVQCATSCIKCVTD